MSVAVAAEKPAYDPRAVAAAGAFAIAAGLAAALSLKIALAVAGLVMIAALVRVRPDANKFVPLLVASVFFGTLTVGGFTLARFVGPIAFLAVTLQIMRDRSLGLQGTILHRWIAAYGTWAVASSFWTWDPGSTAGLLFSLLIAVAYTLAITSFVKNRHDLETAMYAITIAAVTIAVAGLAAFAVLGGAIHAQRVIGDRNFFSALQIIALPLTLLAIREAHERWQKLALISAAGIMVFAIVGSGSQGGMIGLLTVAVVAVVVVPSPSTRRRFLPAAVLMLPIVIGLVVLIVTVAGPGGRQASRTDYKSAVLLSSVDRVNLWRGALHAYEEQPWVGIGYGAYAPNSAELMLDTPGVDLKHYNLPDHPQEAHNAYIGTLAELGPFGVFLFCAMYVCAAGSLLRTAKAARARGDTLLTRASLGLFLGLVGFAVSSFFLSSETNRGSWVIFGLAIVVARFNLMAENEPAGDTAELTA